jgi:prepilin-type N-terminal cleavage/methylation domain-containing protein
MRTGQRQRGYSITEMLTVVAIIGIVSLVLVPNFMSMYRSGKMKSATRNFISRARRIQQQAVTENRRTRICFTPNARTYSTWVEQTNQTTGVKTWVKQADMPLEEAGAANKGGVISFGTTGFTDQDSDSINDIIFNPNGTVDQPSSPNLPVLQIKTSDRIPKPLITVTFTRAGSVTVS